MVFTSHKITEIFYLPDEFCNNFEKSIKKHFIDRKAKRKPTGSGREGVTIATLFPLGGVKNRKHFYWYDVQKRLTHWFPNTVVSYNRFTALLQAPPIPMTLFLKTCCPGKSTGIAFVDSTPTRVCKNKRIKRNNVFEGFAVVGRSTMGYFFGFKLHISINDKGGLLNFVITKGNVDDSTPAKNKRFIHELKGKLFADKGAISKEVSNV